MAQLYLQKNAQPDTWVMSGAPTATTVFLSLAATINYSDGTSDSLPANTKAVLPDTTTVFDRSHDVFVPYTVKGSGVLSIIKESLLPTLTSDYAPLARVELHGIRPYQPEPYLAAGGAGAGTPTTTTVGSAAGAGTVLLIGPGGPPPTGWQNAGFDDSAWAAPVAQDAHILAAPLAGSIWVTPVVSFPGGGDEWLARRPFVLPVGPVTSATLQIWADDFIDAIYLNGVALALAPWSGSSPGWYYVPPATPPPATTLVVPPGALHGGGANVLAVHVRDDATGGDGGRCALDYVLSVQQNAGGGVPDPGGSEGTLLYYHGGAWTPLPVGTSGQELTVVSGDPAWATPPAAGSVTSVAFAGPTGTSVSGSPITSSGTITLSWASQSANTFLGAPSGSSGAPTFRVLVAADIPSLPASQITSGQLAAARGGTGLDGSTASNGQLLIGTGSGYALATLTAGSGVTVTNSSGGISIAATGSGGTVTSVALTMPGIFSVSGSPITGSGTLAVTLANESANTVFAGPASGSAAAPTFRAVQPADLPTAPTAGGHVHAHGHFL